MEEKDNREAEQTGANCAENYDALADAKARTQVQVVELPGFGDGKPWWAKLRRVSLLRLAQAGKIPNGLMSAVTELYQTGVCKSADLSVAAEVMLLMAGEALKEPTLKQLEDAGVTLTDEQLTAIYLYTQRGVQALRPFRPKTAVSRAVPGGADVRTAAQQPDGREG